MNVLLYSNTLSVADKRLRNLIDRQIPADNFKICRLIRTLKSNLKRPACDWLALILLVHHPREITDLADIPELRNDAPLILILPDRKWATFLKGPKFNPLMISHVDSDFSDVAMALAKLMMQNLRAAWPIHESADAIH